MAADYYDLLGVGRNATEDEIKRAYRRLARELHPDTSGGDSAAEERFKEVTLAYETLRDPERRRRYDMFGPEMARGAGTGDPAAGFADAFASDLFGGGIGDLFESFFGGSPFRGGSRRRSGPARGADMEAQLDLEFREAVFGAQKDLPVVVPVICEHCQGSGARKGTTPVTCSECRGSGEVQRVRQSILGQVMTSSPCPRCRGRGEEIQSPCPECRGEGRRSEERVYTVEVPPGVDQGSTLRLSGRGAAGTRGGPNGDLYVHLRVRPDERFQRNGYDLVQVLHVPVTQAALGAHLQYDTLDGTEDLVIPRGTQTGRLFRLRGRGVPHVEGRGRGDLMVQVVVDTPSDLTKEQESLLRLLAAERGEEVAPADTSFLGRIRSAFK